MKPNNLFNHLRLGILSAVDGLLFGAALEVLRRIYTPIFRDYYTRLEIDEAFRNGKGTIVSRIEYIGNYIEIPLLSMLLFALLVPIVYSCLNRFISSPPVLWQLAGMVAATATVLIHHWLDPLGHNLDLLSLHWRWLFCLSIVTYINLFYGLIVGKMFHGRSASIYS